MSTGQQLDYVEERPGQWSAWLEDMSGWDDEDGDEAYRGEGEMLRVLGPLPTLEACQEAFHRQFANTGSWSVYAYDPAHPALHGDTVPPA